MTSEGREPADRVIAGRMVLAGPHPDGVIDKGAVAIRDGKIVGVGSHDDILGRFFAEETLEAEHGLVMPGMVNCHTHAAMTCFRGMADDLPLGRWLKDHVFPAEARFVDEEFVYWGTLLACIEMVRAGTTTFCDGYFFETKAAEAAKAMAVRAVLGQGIVDFSTPDVREPSRNLAYAESFIEAWEHDPLITPALFCHTPYTCSAQTLDGARDIAERKGSPLLIHLLETKEERTMPFGNGIVGPLPFLDHIGFLGDHTVAVHCVWVNDDEIRLLKEKRVKVVHTPESNMKLASGLAPVTRMLSEGLLVGLGTDGCASNNDLDLFSEMDVAAKVHKLASGDPTVMDAKTVFEMATLSGAKVLGLGDVVGSLEVGKRADVIVLNLKKPHLVPLYNVFSHVVYAARGSDVDSVLVDGRFVMREGRIVTVDEEEVMDRVAAIAEKIRSS